MTEYVPQVGDFVQVKTLEQLKDEYRELTDGSFDTPGFCFVREMRGLCGTIFQIDRIEKSHQNGALYLRSVEGIENRSKGLFWRISAGMVNPAEGADDTPEVDEDEWLTLI